MKKLIFFSILGLSAIHVFPVSWQEAENAHKKEIDELSKGIGDVAQQIMTLPIAKWMRQLQQNRRTPYPDTVLSPDEVSIITNYITALESGDTPLPRLGSQTRRLKPTLATIRTTANNVNRSKDRSWFDKEQLPWAKLRGTPWKPIISHFFKHLKALVVSFGPQTKAKAQIQQPEGVESNYFST